MSIECFNLTKCFGKKTALNNVSVEIPEGGITGLIGPNGAGKSTLIKLITGLVYPTQGCVRIDGYDSCYEHIAAMNRLGAIVEWPSFYPDLTARRNLAIFSGGHGKKYEEKLEEVTKSFPGIDSCYAIQAGREIRIMVKPEEVSEDQMVLLARDIAKKIEEELTYPGQIKVHVLRETKAVDYAK